MVHFRFASIKDLEGIYIVMMDTGYVPFKYGLISKTSAFQSLKKDFFPKSFGLFYNSTKVVIGLLDGVIVCYSIFSSYKKHMESGYPKESRNYAYSLGTGVLNKFRGRGLGKQLRLVTDNYAKKYFKGIYTSVDSSNTASIKVQEKTGFTRVDKHHKNGRTDILFRKDF